MYTRIIHRKHRGRKYAVLLLIGIIFFITFRYVYKNYEPLFFNKTDHQSLIKDIAGRHCIDPCLLKAVIWQESRFKVNIRGKNGEIGLMQIRPEHGAVTDWAEKHKISRPCEGILFRPNINIEIGAWYLGRALRRWSSYKYQYELALSEYNAGLRGMQSWKPQEYDGEVTANITIPSTKAYIHAIMDKYQEYAEQRKAVNK